MNQHEDEGRGSGPEEEEDDGEFLIDEDDMVEVGDDEEYVPQDDEGEGEEEEEEDTFDDAIQVFAGHGKQPAYSVAAAHKGDLIASGGGDDKAHLWSAEKGTGAVLSSHNDSVISVSFSADDSWVASAGMDGVVHAKCLTNEKELILDGPGSEIEWIAWHPKHLIILAGSADTTVWMWNVAEEGAMMGVFAGHTDSVTCGSFTPNGRRIVTGSMDGTLKLWDPNGTSLIHTFSGHAFHHGGVVALATKAEDPMVATGGSDGTVCLVKLDSKKILAKFQHAELKSSNTAGQRHADEDGEEEEDEEDEGCSIEAIAFCPTLPWLVSGGTDGRVVVWDLSVQAKRSVLIHPDADAVVRCLFLPQSVMLITACADGKVRKWDVRASHLEKTFAGHRDAILDMTLLPDGQRVVTGSDDGTCRIFAVV